MCPGVLLDMDVPALVQKQHHAVVLLLKAVALCLCAVADGDFVVVLYQRIQSFQKPQENALGFVFEDFTVDERVVRAVGVFGLCLQDELPPLEALGQIVERLQGEIAEADLAESGVRLDTVNHAILIGMLREQIKDKIRELTSRKQARSVELILKRLKRYTTGWLGYYSIADIICTSYG